MLSHFITFEKKLPKIDFSVQKRFKKPQLVEPCKFSSSGVPSWGPFMRAQKLAWFLRTDVNKETVASGALQLYLG